MIKLHKDYRSADRLGQSLAAYSSECLHYTSQLMDSEYHYSGGKSKFRDDFQYQLRNGQYVLDQIEVVITDPETNEVTKRSYEKVPRINDDGSFILSKSDVQEYNIIPNFVAITHVDYDTLVDNKLREKIEQSTLEAISKQKLVTAQQEALTAEALGKKTIAQKTAQMETEKIEAVIRAQKETAMEQEAALKAKFTADKIKWEGEAKASANRALVSAGLSPIDRAKYENEKAIGVAKEMAKVKFPDVMIFGGGGSSPTNPFDALGLEAYMKIIEGIGKKKSKG